jgi:Histidine kinase-, DNA gyrase B-, and HSP90-like ATPase
VREMSLHIMDVAENGIGAGANLIEIAVTEDGKANRLSIRIKDNGRGIPADLLDKVMDPFYTTRTTRRVGLGLSLFREASRRCEGEFGIKSREGEGTEVSATFRLDHIDLAPLGDMVGSLTSLIAGNPQVDFIYTHEVDGRVFSLDTREVKKELEGVEVTHPRVIKFLGELVRDSLEEIRTA